MLLLPITRLWLVSLNGCISAAYKLQRYGYHHVDKLHEVLVKTTKYSISQCQVNKIIACCNALDDYDKEPLQKTVAIQQVEKLIAFICGMQRQLSVKLWACN